MSHVFIIAAPDARESALSLNDALNPFTLSHAQRVQLADMIGKAFSLAELEGLCFALNVPYEELSGDTASKRVRELILWFERQRDIAELIVYCKLNRPLQTIPQAAVAINRIAIQQQDGDHVEHIREALKGCGLVVFIASRDSVRDGSSWLAYAREAAVSYKRRVVTVLAEPVKLPPLLSRRVSLPVSDPAQAAPAIRAHLEWLRTPEGELQTLRERLMDARQDLADAREDARNRIEREIAEIQADIEAATQKAVDTKAAAQVVESRIAEGIERERTPLLATATGTATRAQFINPPPGEAPAYFQNRYVELQVLAQFLRSDQRNVMIVIGRGGIGKTALVCRLLRGLEQGQLPYDLGRCSCDGIVYLSAVMSRPINFANLFADLCRLLPPQVAESLDKRYTDARATTADKMRMLLTAFAEKQRVVVLLDNFETLLDAQSNIADAELDDALRAVLRTPGNRVKFIVTTRERPMSLMLEQPGKQGKLELDGGLDSPYAEDLLRGMDEDDLVGFKTAPDALLTKAKEATRGYPRALEALYAIVSADREVSLETILTMPGLLPDHVVEALVGEAFNRLDPAARRVMIALAVYARPITANAVDFLLQPFAPGSDSAPLLKRLVGMHFVRSDAGRYSLHSVDGAYALSRVGQGLGVLSDIRSLKLRAAEYFVQTRKPQDRWKSLDDLASQLAEFDLRCEAEDWDNSARVLSMIDFDYLLLWGHTRLVAQLHERLQGKIGDARLSSQSLMMRGIAYYKSGDVRRAIEHHAQALAIARKVGDRDREGRALNNLGNCYADLGETQWAIEHYERALAIAREVGDRGREGSRLANLGTIYYELGDVRRAIEFYNQALAIDREVGNRRAECIDLGNLGNRNAELGQTRRAIEFHEQALAIAREISDRRSEGIDLGNLAEVLVDTGDHARAIAHARDAVTIAEALGNVENCCGDGRVLALAYLCSGNLPATRDASERASMFDAPLYRPAAFAVLGVAALRQNDRAAAQAAFESAIAHADVLLAKNDHAFAALDVKSLALCGLAMVTGDAAYADQSRAVYRAARAIIREKGIVGRVLCLLDQLALVASLPAGVRDAAAGE